VSHRGNARPGAQLCWCGSGQAYGGCHQPFARPGPGASLLLAAHPFPWAVRRAPTTPQRAAPPHVAAPEYAVTGVPDSRPVPDVRPLDEIARLRRAGRHAAEILAYLAGMVRPGVTTDALDAAAYDECARRAVYPSTLNYNGYTKSICTSVNEVICHGIPDSRPLRSGDIVNVDVAVFADGVHGDCSATLCVGDVNPVARQLVRGTLRCLRAGIAAVRPGRPFSDIGRAIEGLATQLGCSVVRQFVAHGIGPRFHTGLQVLHHYRPDQRLVMQPGMVFTIEPMINAGTHRAVLWDDGWTAVTADLARSAQFEHTVLVTQRGAAVLTANELAPTRALTRR
jgi:methionyl aminopeptidase